MDIEHLTVETDPAFEDIRFLEDRLYAYHVQQAGVDEGRWLAILVRDDPQTIRAGVEGWTGCGRYYFRTV